MKKANNILKVCLVIAGIGVIGLLWGLGQRQGAPKMGIDIPQDIQVTELADILNNPNNYDGQRVLLAGVVGRGCLACPEKFPYQEGVQNIDIYAKNFRVSGLRRGQQIRVYAEIQAGKERAIISALGLEVR